MRIHYLQHAPFEGPANIAMWAKINQHHLTGTRLYFNEKPPRVNDFDCLVIMGGPMNIYEEKQYSWLPSEKTFIRQAIQENRGVLGVCLGAQLIADVLGAKVYGNNQKEIGWFPVTLTPEARTSALFRKLPDKFTAFHWHGDTFDLPPGAKHIAYSDGCVNQAFLYTDRVLGLQFHLEVNSGSLEKMIANCGDELAEGKFIQSAAQITGPSSSLTEIKENMATILDNLTKVLLPG